jgi:hypothetical protein
MLGDLNVLFFVYCLGSETLGGVDMYRSFDPHNPYGVNDHLERSSLPEKEIREGPGCKFTKGQSKRRTRLIIAVRKLGYTAKVEIRPHIKNINRAVLNSLSYTLPRHNPDKARKRLAPKKSEFQPVSKRERWNTSDHWRYPNSNSRPYGW